MMNQMIGNVFHWTGVVEDRNDPLMLGRVRVRILGLHSESLEPADYKSGEGLPVASLPWAQLIQPVNNASMNGISNDSLGLVEGSWVVGFSRDGRACQDLIVLGSINGIPETTPEQAKGFGDNKDTTLTSYRPKREKDNDEHYPKEKYLNESDVNRLARNEKIDETIVKSKKDSVDKDVSTSVGQTWNEPETPYNAKYPYNHVSESESGHIIERDDTPGSERTHDYHRSGTFNEVHPIGTKVSKVVKDNYEIILGDDFVHINGICNITVDGDANVEIGGDINVHVAGKGDVTIDGDTTLKTPKTIVDSPHIELGKGATEKLVLGDTFMKFLNKFFSSEYNTHTHIGNLGVPTAPPMKPATDMSTSELSADNSFTK